MKSDSQIREEVILRLEVERMVQHVRGVVGISNNIIVTPKVSPDQVQAKIEEAFKREAEIDARHIGVAISDHTARLYGHVHALSEANAARAAAASAPGIASGPLELDLGDRIGAL